MSIFALWCHPRSVSTAFERIMRERGDLAVLHEPFMYAYYLNHAARRFPDFRPDPAHPTSYEAIRDMIRGRAKAGPVFFKDMAYYVAKIMPQDPDFQREINHAFLVRHPAESILSYARRDPDFACEELGIAARWDLYQALHAAGHRPLVILADDLRRDPAGTMRRYAAHAGLSDRPEALTWDAHLPPDWQAVQEWHGDVLASGAILPPAPGPDPVAQVAALGEPFTGYLAHHLAAFRQLRAVAQSPAPPRP